MRTAETRTCLHEESSSRSFNQIFAEKKKKMTMTTTTMITHTKAFMAPAFLWWLKPGLFSLET